MKVIDGIPVFQKNKPKRIRTADYLKWQREYKKNQYEARRSKAIEILGGCCADCGSKNDLHFDHIDSHTKSFPISRPPSEQKFWIELKKCQLLCRKCHKNKSNKENSGEKCHMAKLTNEDVKKIGNRLYNKIPQNQIAKEFGVNPVQISRIKNGTRWKYITDES